MAGQTGLGKLLRYRNFALQAALTLGCHNCQFTSGGLIVDDGILVPRA